VSLKKNNETDDGEQHSASVPKSFFTRFVQPIGALIVTAIAMWYLLGIPASILWEPFYQRLTGLGESQSTELMVDEDNP